MTAITFVNSNSTGSAGNPTSGNWDVSPISFAAGDLAIFWWWCSTSSKVVTPPGTITQLAHTANAGAGRLFVAYRILQAGDTTFGWTATSVALTGAVWGVDVFRDVGFPVSNVSGVDATIYTNDNTPQAPAVSPTYGNSLVYAVVSGNATMTNAVDSSGAYTRSSLRAAGGLPASSVATFFKVLEGGAHGVQEPGPFTLSAASIIDGFLFTVANGPEADLVFPGGAYNLSLADATFEVGRLMQTGGGGGAPHPPLPRFHRHGQERRYAEIVEAERASKKREDDLAVLLSIILADEHDVI